MATSTVTKTGLCAPHALLKVNMSTENACHNSTNPKASKNETTAMTSLESSSIGIERLQTSTDSKHSHNSEVTSPPVVMHGFSTIVSTNTNINTKSPSKTAHKSSFVLSSWDTALNAKASDPLRQNASALDALATLASTAHNRLSMDATPGHDSNTMPPPPPRTRRLGRTRAASNPEGMEKWNPFLCSRTNFVLPTSILEEELASANHACEALEKQKLHMNNQHPQAPSSVSNRPVRRTAMTDFSIHDSQPQIPGGPFSCRDCTNTLTEHLGTSPTTVISSIPSSSPASSKKKSPGGKKKRQSNNAKKSIAAGAIHDMPIPSKNFLVEEELEEEEEVNEADLEPEELLRRARSKLFDDLSAENGLEKGVMAYPHSLDKYKEIYNKNGRIGIYTPAERAAIIAKFKGKRTRRVWNKKIRYNCRKSLADRRMRVKGRFVKRAVEQNANGKSAAPKKIKVKSKAASRITTRKEVAVEGTPNLLSASESSSSSSANSSRASSPIPSAPPSGPLASVSEEPKTGGGSSDMDVDMPDVEDPEAGFKPTSSQPYRRTRRHTIT